MAYANEGASNPVAITKNTISAAVEGFDGLLGRLEQLANRAAACGDKILGPRPTGVDQADKNPAPGNLITEIQARRERLLRAVNLVENEVGRIESGLA